MNKFDVSIFQCKVNDVMQIAHTRTQIHCFQRFKTENETKMKEINNERVILSQKFIHILQLPVIMQTYSCYYSLYFCYWKVLNKTLIFWCWLAEILCFVLLFYLWKILLECNINKPIKKNENTERHWKADARGTIDQWHAINVTLFGADWKI